MCQALPHCRILITCSVPGVIHWTDMQDGLGTRGNSVERNKEKIFPWEGDAGTSAGQSQPILCLLTTPKGTAMLSWLDPTGSVRCGVCDDVR